MSRKQRRPGGAVKVHGAHNEEGQQRVELPMLLDQMVANVVRTYHRHPVQHTGTSLDRQLAFVPGRLWLDWKDAVHGVDLAFPE
jgi:hypothetical protein